MSTIQRIPNPFSNSFSNAVVIPMGEYSVIYIGGQVGHPPEGPVKVTAEPFEEEAKLCMVNVEKALKKAGASLKDVIRITTYLTDLENYPAWDKVRKATFQGALPASSTVGVKSLLVNARMEIDTVAVIKTGKSRG
ncbi:MAG TPA: RidA family protein [Terriglobales bacterium]|nr:RidA family protein [Terriglobales bacterium]